MRGLRLCCEVGPVAVGGLGAHRLQEGHFGIRVGHGRAESCCVLPESEGLDLSCRGCAGGGQHPEPVARTRERCEGVDGTLEEAEGVSGCATEERARFRKDGWVGEWVGGCVGGCEGAERCRASTNFLRRESSVLMTWCCECYPKVEILPGQQRLLPAPSCGISSETY